MASGERQRSPHRSRSSSRIQQLIFFLILLSCGCRLTAAAARAKSTLVLLVVLVVLVVVLVVLVVLVVVLVVLVVVLVVLVVVLVVLVVVLVVALLPRMESGERQRSPTAAEAAAGLNFEMLIVVNNKFVD